MVRAALIAALLLSSGSALAQAAPQDQQAATGQPPKRVRNVTLTGDQKCPESTAEEVVVCGRDDEPYRIPKALRDDRPIPAPQQVSDEVTAHDFEWDHPTLPPCRPVPRSLDGLWTSDILVTALLLGVLQIPLECYLAGGE